MATGDDNDSVLLQELNITGDPDDIDTQETGSSSSSNVDNECEADIITVDQADAATYDSNSDSASALSAEWSEISSDTRRVELEEGRSGFGFSISGGVMSPLGHVPLFIASVDPHGPAAKTELMKPGDRILAINGESMEARTHRDAVIAIKAACGPITIDLTQGDENILDFIVMD
ncbi:multiple PDZ domain protein-like [Glandiceps talaboti]